MSHEFSADDTVIAPSGSDALIGRVIGNYKVTDVLGKGGFGAVYKATDTKLGRTVALKFLRQTDETFHAELFEREARALGALSKHGNIVQIHAWDEYNGANFFVLEYMSSSVADEVKNHPDGMPIDKALKIIAECADALSFAHEAEILHRDIKAQNILLEERDGTAKIADFGLARICGTSNHTIEGQAIGSPVYMAPEQARGHKLTHLCDIYSLGVTLYELLSGKPSVSGSSILEVLEKVRNNDRVPLRTMKPGLPDAVYAIVDRATAPEPANRYQSAADMAADLRRVDVHTTSAPAVSSSPVREASRHQDLSPLTTSAAEPVANTMQHPAPVPSPGTESVPVRAAVQTPAKVPRKVELPPEPPRPANPVSKRLDRKMSSAQKGGLIALFSGMAVILLGIAGVAVVLMADGGSAPYMDDYGSPGIQETGFYDANGNWVDTSNGYYDNNGHYISPNGGIYDSNGYDISGSDGYFDPDGNWFSGSDGFDPAGKGDSGLKGKY